MHLLLKSGIANTFDRLGILRLLRYLRSREKAIILTFHRVLEAGDLALCYDPHLVISANNFDALLSLLAEEFNVVTLSDLANNPGSPRQQVAISFDDGWHDTYSVALPLLQEHRLPATVFLCSELVNTAQEGAMLPEERFARVWNACSLQNQVDPLITELKKCAVPAPVANTRENWARALKQLEMTARCLLLAQMEARFEVPPPGVRSLMTWEEARIMAQANITLGSHTRRHCTLPSENSAVALDELLTSRADISRETGQEVTLLAYPNGAYTAQTADLAREAGYTQAFTTEKEFVTRQSPRWATPRFAMDDLIVASKGGGISRARARLYLQALT